MRDRGAKRVVILGAGGRDFHNFNVYFRKRKEYEVVAFTASQIPGVGKRVYPPHLAGELYPNGIPILPESSLEEIVREMKVDVAVLSYSDLTYGSVGRIMSRVLAAGASFMVLGPSDTMLKANKPVIAVTAVRTGAGKSSVSRKIAKILSSRGYRVVPVRHPMAYRGFDDQVECFSTVEELDKRGVTVEEREEYEHYVSRGYKVCSGIDYEEVLKVAEREADVILWDGGNNDWPFVKPDYHITIADALRPGQEIGSFPGEVNVRTADLVVINKVDQARREEVEKVRRNVLSINPRAKISLAASTVSIDEPELVRGKRVAVVEDSPTVTHGEAPYGAGYVAALKYGAAEVVDPRKYAVGVIAEMFREYPHMINVIPSTGYTREQIRDLEETLRRVPADVIVSGTPIDLSRLIKVDKPIVRVSYEVEILEGPTLEEAVEEFLSRTR
ncbi:MAG: cyclic 2,3-diphosphoglycerate synthase [Acidilobaceae archaeon]|nr:cyclic 2,3-diphosphoglycerate synthase [Acidilobaceae archaeon]MCX8165713.1 cyclic 2,3-diphosphoglycerate synthase [Acidilobaceae archaeon]MDW7974138.1 cyclic 2,3-diphosphoglycerate synthase [Sulfolobales archaeon]